MPSIRSYILEMSYVDAVSYIHKLDPSFPKHNISSKDISKARKVISKKYHPDTGHKGDELKLANDALDTITSYGEVDDSSEDSPYSQEPIRKQQSNRKEDVPIWAWAGYGGGLPPDFKIRSESPSDLNWIKREAWELGRGKTDEYSFSNFDGRFFRNGITVFTDNEKHIIDKVAHWVALWDRWYNSKAIVVSSPMWHKETVVIPMEDNKNPYSARAWFKLKHNSFNQAAGNDQKYVDELIRRLEEIRS